MGYTCARLGVSNGMQIQETVRGTDDEAKCDLFATGIVRVIGFGDGFVYGRM